MKAATKKRKKDGTKVLDSFIVELRIGEGKSEGEEIGILWRLDRSKFEAGLKSRIQQALNSADLDDVQCQVRR